MDKRISSSSAAVGKVADGATILMGGFGLCGIPENLIAAGPLQGHQRSHHNQQQCRYRMTLALACFCRTVRSRNDFHVRRRKQTLRAIGAAGRTGGGVESTGHVRGANSRGRRRHPRVLHSHRPSARWSQMGRRRANSRAARMFWNARSAAILPSSRPGRVIAGAI